MPRVGHVALRSLMFGGTFPFWRVCGFLRVFGCSLQVFLFFFDGMSTRGTGRWCS